MKKLVVCLVVVMALASLLASPPGLSAKGRRGAVVVVIRHDGGQVRGEIIAVKPDSLLILRGGADLSIPRAKIHSVQILRRSQKGPGTLWGLLIGAAVGVGLGMSYGDSGVHGIRTPVKVGEVAGGLGALIGFWASSPGGVNSTIPLAGVSGSAADARWSTLIPYSREARRAEAARRR